MSAKTTAHDEQRKDCHIQAYKMAAGVTIFKGSTVMLDSNGFAYSNDGTNKTLSADDVFVGICVENMTNNGADGEVYVRAYRTGAKVTITAAADTVEVGEIVEVVSANLVRIDITRKVGSVVVA